MELDLTQHTKDNVKQTPNVVEVVLTDVTQKIAEDIYGSKAYDPHKVYLRLTFENAEAKITHTEDYAFYEVGELDDRSKLGKFITKYGDLKVGTKVMLIKNKQTGFYELLLDE